MAAPDRRAARRKQILEAALEVFSEKGYPYATVDDIAERVSVARGTFYLYFGDKRAVFEALLDGFLERVGACIEAIDLEHPTDDARAQLRANVTRVIMLALSEPGIVRLALLEARGLDPEVDAKLGDFHARLRLFLVESLAEGQRAGVVREGDRDVIASVSLGGFRELLTDAVTGNLDRSPEQLVDATMTFLEGWVLAAPPAPKKAPRRGIKRPSR
jgi:AcrR family transcriptional regulator